MLKRKKFIAVATALAMALCVGLGIMFFTLFGGDKDTVDNASGNSAEAAAIAVNDNSTSASPSSTSGYTSITSSVLANNGQMDSIRTAFKTGTSIRLEVNTGLSDPLVLNSGTANIDLNGHILSFSDTSTNKASVIQVNGGTLNIYDSAATTLYGFNMDSNGQFLILNQTSYIAGIRGGMITAGVGTSGNGSDGTISTSKYGGAIYINGGTVNMYAGTLTGNGVSGNNGMGGAVYVQKGTFHMEGGTIAGNYATHSGGGIATSVNSSAKVEIASKKPTYIVYNSAKLYGGGMAIRGSTSTGATGSITAATISGSYYPQVIYNFADDTTSSCGGGLYLDSTANMDTIDGYFEGNVAGVGSSGAGGGVYSAGGSRTFKGYYLHNTTYGNGGGIYCAGDLLLSGATIKGNNAGGAGGGVYSNGAFSMTNSSITRNVSVSKGAGVWLYAETSASTTKKTLYFVGVCEVKENYQAAMTSVNMNTNAISDKSNPSDLYNHTIGLRPITTGVLSAGTDIRLQYDSYSEGVCMTSNYAVNNGDEEPTQFFNLDSPLYAIKQYTNTGKDLIIESAPEANVASTDGYFNVSYRLFSLAAQRFNSTTSPNNYAATNTQIPTDNAKVMTLLKDISIAETTSITSSGKIDFNGKALVYTGSKGASGSGSVLIFDGGITVTVTGSTTASKSFNTATGTKLLTYASSGGSLSYTMGGVVIGGDGNSAGGGISLKNGANVTWEKVWIVGNTSNEGGAIYVNNSTLSVTNCFVFRNTSDWGAIFMNNGATVTLGASTYIQENSGTGVSNTGDGGAVNIGSTGNNTLNINDGATIKANTGRNGGALYANSGTINMNGGTITANTATGNGGVAYMKAGTLNLIGGTIGGSSSSAGNTASGEGGAVYMYGGTLNLSGTTLQYNSASKNGGAVYVYNGATFTMTGGTIDHNSVATTTNGMGGGAICALGSATVNITGGTISNNSTSSALGAGGAILSLGTLTISGATFTGNSAAIGGAISSTSSVSLTGVTISNNTTSSHGGGLFLNGSTYTITDSTISGNTSASYGGGVFVNKGTLTLSGSTTITSNTSTDDGGGVYLASQGVLVLAGGAPRITGNVKGSATNNVYLLTNKTISVTGKLSTGTSGALVGVTLASYTPVQYVTDSGYGTNGNDTSDVTTFVLDDTSSGNVLEVESNKVALVAPVASVTSGGTTTNYGVYTKALTAFNAKTSDNNAILKLLADITTTATSTLSSSGTLDLNNHVLKYSNDASSSTVFVLTIPQNVTITVTDTSTAATRTATPHYYTLSNNLYTFGATSGSSITGGVITGGTRGAVNLNGTLNLVDGTIAGNKNTDGNGAGIQINSTGTVNMSGGAISGNVGVTGGGVRVNGTMTLSGGTISNNVATTNGAGVYVSGTFNMTGGTVSSNTSSNGGGGIVVATSSSTVRMSGGTISNNTASSGNGGGIDISNGNVYITGGTISGNSASAHGGGISKGGSSLEISNATISDNTTANYGGGLYIGSGTATLGDGTNITGNTVTSTNGHGAGVYLNNSGALKFASGVIKVTGNSKSGATNNLYLYGNKTVTIDTNATMAAGSTVGVTLQSYPTSGSRNITSGYNSQTTINTYFTLDDTTQAGGLLISSGEVAYGQAIAKLTIGSSVSHYTVFETAVTDYNASTDTSKVLQLLANISVTSTSTFTATGKLDLNGYRLQSTASTVVAVQPATSGATAPHLTLIDSRPTQTTQYYQKSNEGYYEFQDSSTDATGTISGGVIVGTSGTRTGVAVSDGATFTMEKGAIAGNKGNLGGGLYVNGAIAVLKGGTIAGNYAAGGAGVYITGASNVRLEGTNIQDNAQSTGHGAGVYVGSAATFTMTSGYIRGNGITATGGAANAGAGVYNEGTFKMTGGEICYNLGVTGGIYSAGGSLTFGGTAKVRNNASYTSSQIAGVFPADNTTVTVYGTPVISGNKQGATVNTTTYTMSGGTDSNIYLLGGKKITVSDEELQTGASIGVSLADYSAATAGNPRIITEGYDYLSTTEEATYFTLDDTTQHGGLYVDSGEVVYGVAVASVTKSDTTVSYHPTIGLAVTAYNNAGSNSAPTLKLLTNIETGTKLTLSATGMLDLYGYQLAYNGSTSSAVLHVEGGSTVTVYDTSTAGTKHYYTSEVSGTVTANDTGISVTTYFYTFGATSGSYITGGVITGGTDGAITVASGSRLIIAGGTIAGNSADGGGAIYSEGKVDLYGGTIVGNKSTANGGAIYLAGSGATLSVQAGSLITSNYAAAYGGGVYADERTTGNVVTVNDGTFDSQYAELGGNIYVASESATVTINGGTLNKGFAHASSTCGGNIYAAGNVVMTGGTLSVGYAGNGGNIYAKGTVTFSGGTLSGADSYKGAGIYGESDVTVTGGTITGNYGRDGSAINAEGNLSLSNCVIEGNTNNGGYAVGAKGTITLSGKVIIRDNKEVSHAGDVYNGNLLLTDGQKMTIAGALTGSEIGLTVYGIANGKILSSGYGAKNPLDSTNTSRVSKVQVMAADGTTSDYVHPEQYFSLDTYTGQTITYAIGIDTSEVIITKAVVQVTSDANKFVRGYSRFSSGLTKYNLLTNDSDKVLKLLAENDITETATFTSSGYLDLNGQVLKYTNAANGAVVRISGDGTQVTLIDSNATAVHYYTVASNLYTVDDSSTSGETLKGGVITGGTGATVSGYTDTFGGGVYIDSDATFVMNAGNIVGNSATGGYARGAGVYVSSDATFTMTNGLIAGNVSEGKGGGIFSSGKVTLNGTASGSVKVMYNVAKGTASAVGGGAGVYIAEGTASITYATIAGNTAVAYGGGIYIGAGTLALNNVSVINNTTGARGGGIYAGGTVTISNTEISGNAVTGLSNPTYYWGGGVSVEGGTVTLTNSHVTNNMSDSEAAGICVNNNGTLNLVNTEVTNNGVTATSTGRVGGVWVKSGTLNISGATKIVDNSSNNAVFDTTTHTITTAGSADRNLYLTAGAKINVVGDVTGAEINISIPDASEGRQLTSGLGATNATLSNDSATGEAPIFSLDALSGAGSYVITLKQVDGNNEAVLAAAVASLTYTATGATSATTKAYIVYAQAISDYNTVEGTGRTLKLLKDITTDVTSAFTADGTFNLNKRYLKYTGTGAAVTVGVHNSDSVTLTIEDSGTAVTHYYKVDSGYKFQFIESSTGATGSISGGLIVGGQNSGIIVFALSTLTLTGGTVAGNSAANGGGVYVHNGATFTMTGGTITGNMASTQGGGVYVETGATFNVSGSPSITNNHSGSTSSYSTSNVYLDENVFITIVAALSDAAEIGVTPYNGDYKTDDTGIFTTGYNGTSSSVPADDFSADDGSHVAVIASNGEVTWRAHVHSWTFAKDGDHSLIIVATCDVSGCPFDTDNNGIGEGGSITLAAPTEGLTYDGGTHDAVITNTFVADINNSSAGRYTVTYKILQDDGSWATVLTTVNAGTYKVTLTAGGVTVGDCDTANDPDNVTYMVGKAQLTINISDAEITYGDAVPAILVTFDGFKGTDNASCVDMSNVTYTFTDENSNVYTKDNGAGSAAGNYTVGIDDLSVITSANYTVSNVVAGTLIVNRRSVTVNGITANLKTYDGTRDATTYKGTNYVSVIDTSEATITNVYGNDVITLKASGVSGTYNTKDVGYNNKVITLTYAEEPFEGTAAGNYIIDVANSQTKIEKASIVAKTVKLEVIDSSVSGNVVIADKTYDGTTAATIKTINVYLFEVADSDDVELTVSAVFASKDVAYDASNAVTTQDVTVTYTISGGTDVDNYRFSGNAQTKQEIVQGKIEPAGVRVLGITADGKTYDGTTDVSRIRTDAAAIIGLVTRDGVQETFTLNVAGSYEDRFVGQNKKINLTTTLVGVGEGNLASNYKLLDTTQKETYASITAKAINIDGITVGEKTYDGTTTVGASQITAKELADYGILAADITDGITLVVTGNYMDANAGSSKIVILTVNLVGTKDGVNLADNYIITAQSVAFSTIKPAELTITGGITAGGKIYDGTAEVKDINYSGVQFDGIVNNEEGSVGIDGVATFIDGNGYDTADAGTWQIEIKDIVLTGDGASNYVLSSDKYTRDTLSATISKKTITVSGIMAVDGGKEYDGRTNVDLNLNSSDLSIDGLIDGDTLEFTADASFADANAGVDKPITINSFELLATGAYKNYELDTTGIAQQQIYATIRPREIVVESGLQVGRKVYDRTTDADIIVTNAKIVKADDDTVDGFLGNDGDNITLIAKGSFDSATAGDDRVVTISDFELVDKTSGALVTNYTIIYNVDEKPYTIINQTIHRREIQLLSGITADDKYYDGNTTATFTSNELVFDNAIAGDVLKVDVAGVFSDKNAAENLAVTITSLTLKEEGDYDNYTLSTTYGGGAFTASIKQRVLVLTQITIDSREYDGTTNVPFNEQSILDALAFAGVPEDELALVRADLTVDGVYASANAGTYNVDLAYTFVATSNYTFDEDDSQKIAEGIILARKIIVTDGLAVNNDNKIYSGSDNADISTTDAVIKNVVTDADGNEVAGTEDGIVDADKDKVALQIDATYDDRNVGENKKITINDITLVGDGSENYEVVFVGYPEFTANILPATISVGGIAAGQKTYDGTTDAPLDYSNVIIDKFNEDDDISITAVGTYEDANAGENKPLHVTDVKLVGANAGNYILDDDSTAFDITGTIGRKVVQVPSVMSAELTYTGATQSPAALSALPADIDVGDDEVLTVGTYEILIGLADTENMIWSNGSTDDLTFTLVIKPLAIAKPTADSSQHVYNGEEQTYNLEESNWYTIDGATQTEVGTYEVTVSLTDPNTVWEDGTTAAITYTFVIENPTSSIIWLLAVLGGALLLELLWLAVLRNRKNKLKMMSIAPAPLALLTVAAPEWEVIAILAGAVIVLVLLVILFIATMRYFKAKKNKQPPKESEGVSYELSSDGNYYIAAGIGSCTDKEVVLASTVNDKPVTEIKENAFRDCAEITSVYIPKSIVIINAFAFEGCDALEKVTLAYEKGKRWFTCDKDGNKQPQKKAANNPTYAAKALKETPSAVWAKE